MTRFHLESLGCAKNQVDSELLISCLSAGGWALSESADADVIIVNSCGFIESAKRESVNAVLSFRKRHPTAKIVLAGCLAVRHAKELRESLTEADVVCPTSDPQRIAGELIGAALAAADPGGRPLLSLPGSAYVKIAEGCDNRCTFCAIPLMRGALRSRTIPDIKAEFDALRRRGVQEICLVAQDSASFGAETAGKSGRGALPELLETLLQAEGRFWIRLLYLHPDHFPYDIIPLMQGDPRLLPYFDIPFQHSAKDVLRAMGRRGDGKTYLALVEKIRAALPGAALRSTFLTGFPGESDADFDDLLDFQKNAQLEWAGVFCYSREEGTPACAFKKRPAKKRAAERKTRLEEAQIPISGQRLDRFIGAQLDVLVEEKIEGEGEENLFLGRAYLNAPDVDGAIVVESSGELHTGALVSAQITARADFDLQAEA
ncbi:MAG: 30S ribosomal protein S12 methylthiotransferase RimO [Spirochaetaceae bacterium]|nr:30S ribosomal protein S12 methylthiotransferase RimO [Spirochaetaceae bacterium]